MTTTDQSLRVTVHLNAAVPLEGLIMTRLRTLPGPARQRWLQSLLVEGFLIECRLLSHMLGTGQRSMPHRAEVGRCIPLPATYAFRSPARFTGNNGNAGPSVVPAAEAGELPPVNGKPFAHLRGVIG